MRAFKSHDTVYNPMTNEFKVVFLTLDKTFMAADGSIHLVDDWVLFRSNESVGGESVVKS